MEQRNRYDGMDEYAINLIQYKAYQLVGKAGLTEADRPDLEQDLMLDLLQRMDKFNPARAKKNTFIARVVEHRVCTILDARHAAIRDWRRCQTSLNERVRNCEDVSVAERIDMVNSEGEFGCHEDISKMWKQEELRLDVERVVQSLPPNLQKLCEKLSHFTIREISRQTGVHHSKLYEQLYEIQDAFTKARVKK